MLKGESKGIFTLLITLTVQSNQDIFRTLCINSANNRDELIHIFHISNLIDKSNYVIVLFWLFFIHLFVPERQRNLNSKHK